MVQLQRSFFGLGNRPTNALQSMQPSAFMRNPPAQSPMMLQTRGAFPLRGGGGVSQGFRNQGGGLLRNLRATNFSNPPIPQQSSGGGFLARLFGGGHGMVQNPAVSSGLQALNPARALPAAGSGIVETAGKLGGINKFLSNTQHVLKAAQTLGPVVQQYGPLIKNLPAMWKLYRSLNDEEESDSEEDIIDLGDIDGSTEEETEQETEEKEDTEDEGGIEEQGETDAGEKENAKGVKDDNEEHDEDEDEKNEGDEDNAKQRGSTKKVKSSPPSNKRSSNGASIPKLYI